MPDIFKFLMILTITFLPNSFTTVEEEKWIENWFWIHKWN